MFRVLFVCHGNICRSPMAEYCLRDLLKKAGLSDRVCVESAATSAEELGSPVYPPVRRLLASHGIDCSGKTARQITPADYKRFDLIVGMDRANLRNMARIFGGDGACKIVLLKNFLGQSGDVADPWYTRDFDLAYAEIEEGCKALVEDLKKRKV